MQRPRIAKRLARRSLKAWGAAILMVFSVPSNAHAASLFGWFQPAESCSSNPNHEGSARIDFTAGQHAAEVFKDAQAGMLAAAIERHQDARVAALLKQGADPNAHGEKGLTMLGWSMRRNNSQAFQALLNAGADATVPEHMAAHSEGADSGRTVMHYAVQADDASYLESLLAHHVSPDLRSSSGSVPLIDSMLWDCDKRFHRLIAAHANVNIADEAGDTPLHTAAMTNSFERVLDLLRAGADPMARNRIGKTFQVYLRMTPQRVLSQQGKAEIAQVDAWLMEHHVPVEPAAR